VREVLEGAAAGLDWRWPAKEPVVLLAEFGDSSVNFEVSIWIDDPWVIRKARSDLNEAIWWALKEAGIVIAFPQVDVHFDPEVTRSLQGLGRAS
jgi:small-conductance mechanosensitive channel